MKIALINAVCGSGSTGSICEELSDTYIAKGHECIILYGNRESNYTYAKKIASKLEIKINALLARVTGMQGYFSYISTWRCIRTLETYKPDVVHIHNLHGNYINVCLLLRHLKKKHIRTVITLHDCWFYTGKCTHYAEVQCYEWKKKCGNCPLLHRDIPSLFFDRTQRMLMDKAKQYKDFKELSVIAVSEWIANQARQSILKNTEIKTIYNWVDLESFKIRKVERTEKFVVLGVSAKWIKGSSKLEDFFKLSNMLSSDEEVWLVGEQPPGLQIPSNIVSIPYVKDAVELSRIYNKADVYVHLSREDSFGKVIIEAMACGTPVIVYNSTVYPEIVSNDCGFISDLGDVRQVYNYIKKVKAMGKDYFLDKCLCRARKYEKNNIINETFSYYLQKASMGRSQNDSISH